MFFAKKAEKSNLFSAFLFTKKNLVRVKKHLLFASLLLLFIGILEIKTATSNSNGRAIKTGAPGEGTCRDCHNSNALNASGGSVTISSPTLLNNEYAPGQTYTINVTVERNGLGEFGFGFEALRASGANAGTLAVTNATEMHILTGNVSGNIRNTMTHKTNAGLATNTKTFSFNWTAPAAGTGTVSFYATGNAVNQSGNTSGDFVYSTSMMLNEANPNGVADFNMVNAALNVFPNPSSGNLQLSFNAPKAGNYLIELKDLKSGALVYNEQVNASNSENNFTLENNNWLPGVYLLSIQNGQDIIYKKIVIH